MGVGQGRPVILVGHSLGGLVLKKLSLEASREASLVNSGFHDCCRAFCDNLSGAFFFATPHGGSKLAGLADKAFGLLGASGPVLQYLQVFSEAAADVNREFWLRFPVLRFMAVVETEKVKAGPLVRGELDGGYVLLSC